MNIMFTKNQIKLLVEKEIKYDNDYIQNDMDKLQKIYDKFSQKLIKIKQTKIKYANIISNLTIIEISNNRKKYEEIKNQLIEYNQLIEDMHSKLFYFVEKYDFFNRPKIINDLEFNVTNKIQEENYEMNELVNILDYLLDAANYFTKISFQ